MDLGGVQQGNAAYLLLLQNQRQFGPAQNNCLNLPLLLHPADNFQELLTRLRQKQVLQQLTQVFLVDVSLLIFLRRDQRNSFPGKNIRIKLRLHGEASSEQSGFADPPLLCLRTCCLDNADQRDGRAPLELIENNVRRVGGDNAEVASGASELLQPIKQVFGDRVQPIHFHEVEQLRHVEAVNENCRRASIRPQLTIAGDKGAVVIDCGLGPDSANDPDSFHGALPNPNPLRRCEVESLSGLDIEGGVPGVNIADGVC